MPSAALLVTFALIATACEDKAQDATDFCGPGTHVENGNCIANLACGPGTTQVDGQCVVSEGTGALPCGAGTVADGIFCVVAPEACAPGTTLADGVCLADEPVCGAGTEASEDGCVLAETACGTDTAREGDACVGTLACGEGAERVGDECVGPLYCDSALEAVEIEDAEGVPACVSTTWGPIDASTMSLRLAKSQCESRFRCCEVDALAIADTGGGDFGQYGIAMEEGACVEQMTLIWDIILALPEARLLLAESPPRATFDAEYAELLVDLFVANEECQLVMPRAMIDRLFQSELGGLFGGIFQGERALDEPCSVTAACAEGLVCRDPDPAEDGDTLTCLAAVAENGVCENDEECGAGLYCFFNPNGSCQPRLDAGEICSDDVHCAEGLSCFEGPDDSRCQPIADPAEGFLCDSTGDCAEDEYCQATSDPAFCESRSVINAPCDETEECPEGAVCLRDNPEDESGLCSAVLDPCVFFFGR